MTQTDDRKIDAGDSSFDDQVDQMMADIESDGGYLLRTQDEAEELDPEDIVPDDMPPATPEAQEDLVEGELAPGEGVDELTDAFDVTSRPPADEAVVEQLPADDAEADEAQQIERRRHRLRAMLVIFVVILLLIATLIGIFVWQGSLSPNVTASDTEELTTPSAGTGSVTFEAVQNDAIPQIMDTYGMSASAVKKQFADSITFEDSAVKTSDSRVPSVTSTLSGTVVDAAGTKVADVGFGLNKGNKVVYMYALFDLDALAVANADFSELVTSDVVAVSLFRALGMSDTSSVSAAIEASSGGAVSTDSDSKKTATFMGDTGMDKPSAWELSETYDMSIGQVAGDNSVMRTLLIEFY